MSDDHKRLSPYVRDEEALQRGIEQTALAQTRAAMTTPDAPSTAQVLVDRELLEALVIPMAGGATVQVCRVCGHWGSILRHDSGCPVLALQSALAQAQPSSSAGEVLKACERAMQKMERKAQDWGRGLRDKGRALSYRAAAGILRDELAALTQPQAHADQQARLTALVEGWRAEACLEAIDSWERGYNAGVNGCVEELEAVLGRENE